MSDTPDCTERCSSEIHGDILCAALTKREVTDHQLCAFLSKICCCCGSVKDSLGRTAVHIAASCGRTNIIKWLVNYKHANINAKDAESGYTPLHRSIYYGKIHTAISLLKMGACIETSDFDGLTVIEHAMKDLQLRLEPCLSNGGEMYVWGQNTNYTLGPHQARSMPERLDLFYKDYPDVEISCVCLEKFHSILLTRDGKVFASGHGQGGRLGLSTEETVLLPKQIRFGKTGSSPNIKQISIARDHSVFLNENGQVFTCGLNTHKVLGLNPPPPNVLAPRQVQINDVITGICAGRYHTVAFTKTNIYTWGLHGGQLGLDKTVDRYVISPKLVTASFGADSKISFVSASNGATAIYTNKGDIYVLHEYQCRKIASRKLNIVSISVVGGKLNKDASDESSKEIYELKIIALNISGNLYLWREGYPQFSKCIYSISRGLKVTHLALNDNGVLFVTNTGEAFHGIFKLRKGKPEASAEHQKKSANSEFLEKGDYQMLKLKKIPRIHRGLAIYSDLKGLNFAVLQANPRIYQRLFPNISPPSILEDMRFLLEKTDEEDEIHDIIFKVNNYNFPAHKYICALASSKLEEMFSNPKNDECIEIENENEYIFASLLSYIYTGVCDLLKSSKFKECCDIYTQSLKKSEKEAESTEKYSPSPNTRTISCKDNPLFALRDLAKKLGIKQLFQYLEGVTFLNGIPKFKHLLSECKPQLPKKELLPQFYDVHIMSKDRKQISAHKCILVARMEYFENLFSVRWSSNSSPNEISVPFPHAVLELLIDYVYTDELPLNLHFEVDLACNLLIAADHFLLQRLKEICELAISSHLSLRNVAQLIQFSYDYNAPQLKDCCMEFILQNLPALLELRTLEAVDENILVDLSEFYSNFNKDVSHRVLTPYSNAPRDDDIVSAENDYSITFIDPEDDEVIVRNVTKSTRKRNRTRKSSGNSFRKELPLEEISDNSLNYKYDQENSNENQIETDKSQTVTKQGGGVKNRVETIMNAQELVTNDINHSSYTLLPLKHEEDDLDEEEFPYLGKYSSHNLLSQSPGKSEKGESKLKFTKLSQKQRKRLSSGGSTNEKEVAALSVSPKNPWKTLPDPTSPIGSPEVKSTIDSIITDEKKMKENFVKMKTKSLFYTQIEDHAIEDLLKFYNADKVFDEIITVARVQNTVIASPLWIHSNRSKT